MSIPFAAIVTPDSIIFTDPTGKTHSVLSDNTNYSEIKLLIKKIGVMKTREKTGEIVSLVEFDDAMDRLMNLVTPAKVLVEKSDGRVTVDNGTVYYGSTPIHTALAERILWGLTEGFNMDSYILFLENLMQNPSKRSVSEVYTFIERNKMGITDDGHILGYKRVREDFKDIHSGMFDNSPGQIVTMVRNQVDDDANRTCSTGLHFCSQSYLPSFGSGNNSNKIIIVKVNPADIVSVPVDYNAAKARACRYEVLGEYTGSDKDDLLSTKAIFETDSFRDHDHHDDDHNDDDNDNDDDDNDDDDDDDDDNDNDSFDDVCDYNGNILHVGDVVTYHDTSAEHYNGKRQMELGEHFVVIDVDGDDKTILINLVHGSDWYDSADFLFSHPPSIDDVGGTTTLPVNQHAMAPDIIVNNESPPSTEPEPKAVAEKELVADARYDSGYEAGYKTSGILDDMTLDVIKARISFDSWSNGFVAGYKQKIAEGNTETVSMTFDNLPNGEILSNETINSPPPVITKQPIEPITEKTITIPNATPLHTDISVNKPVKFDPVTGQIKLG